jgi:hypothetical protein
LYGKPRVHLEAFTSFQHWAEGPQDLKPSADRVFTEGGNHFVWHTWTHQAPGYGLPGLVYGAGTHLSRSVTWWPKAKPFLDYLARGSFLLQRGTFVADALYYYGDGGMNFVGPRRNPSTLGPGYDYDVTNAEVLLKRLSVRDGRLTLPDGTSYAVLVLPEGDAIHPPVLEKIEALVRDGAAVIGPRPARATGLEGFPETDRRVHEIASRLWGDLDGRTRLSRKHGRGQVFMGMPERDVLAQLKVAPDFEAPAALDFIHRRDAEGEIYFVRNKTAEAVNVAASFRDGGAASFWDPMSGSVHAITDAKAAAGRTEVPLKLAAHGAGFVVFRKGTSPRDSSGSRTARAVPGGPPASLNLDSGWTVEFSTSFEAPPKLDLQRVQPWTQQQSAAHRFFAGSGKYRHVVKVSPEWRAKAGRVDLELGRLWAIGEVWVNGISQGIVWAPPFSLDCTSALRDGENEIVVEVVGTWHNRLVGEARGELPKRTRTNITTSQRQPWKELEPIPSGLFGPVRLAPRAEP